MLLLDSHVLLWYLDTGPDLSALVRTRIDTEPSVFVSVVSAWELRMPDDLPAQLTAARFDVLPITLAHALASGALPPHHRDPFDRMLIAQAQLEGLMIVTHDALFRPYGVPILWT